MIDFIAGIFVGATLTLVFFLAYFSVTEKRAQQAAVDHGAASWVVDQKTGTTTFQWKN